MKMIDEASRAQPRIELAPVRVGGPVAAVRAKRGIAHQRLSEQADQFLAIDILHPAEDMARTEEQQSVRSYNQVRDYLQ